MDTVACPVQDAVSFCRQGFQQPLYAEPVDRLPMDTHVHPSMLNDSLAAKLSPKQVTLPNVGQTRCYWALLTSSLQFLVLDPVLAFHLKEQAVRFLESSLLDFVHPEEQESARHDLGNVLKERTLHGSVTRVRYCRLSRVRRLLGCQESTPPYPPTFPAERIAIDSDYMAVYLVINCVAEGLVLCFIHAVVDIAPREDNDEIRKTAWTNWCSTYGFDEEQARALYQRLCESVLPNQVAFHHDADQPLCVLQILRNQHDRPLVLSWPPSSSIQARYVTPAAQDLARLAQHVQIGYSMGGGGGGDARTSCTRRYKSVQNVNVHTAEGIKSVQVESIFIPHGTIIFACHKVDGCYLTRDDRESSTQTQQSLEFLQMSGHDHQQLFSDQSSYDPSFLADSSQHELTSQAYVQQWVEGQVHVQLFPQQRQQQLWDQIYAPTESSPSNCSSVFHTRTDSYSTESACGIYQAQWSNQAQFLGDSSTIVAGTSYVRAQSPCAPTGEALGNTLPSLLPTETTATVHALANVKRISPTPLDDAKTRDRRSPAVSGSVGSQMENYSGCGRSAGNPRAGAMRCSSCQATHSPEWRKGPSGKKDLCNACGLRFARSRAKKEGVTSRKRKEKGKKALVTRRDQTTPVSGASDASSSRSSAQSFVRSQRPDDSCDSASSLPSEAPITPSIPNIQSQSHYSDQNMPAQSLTPSPTLPDFPYLPSNRVDVRQQHLHPESHSFVTAGPYYPIAPSPSYISQQEHGAARTLPTILSAQYRPRLVSSEQPVSSFFERNTAEDKTKHSRADKIDGAGKEWYVGKFVVHGTCTSLSVQ